MSFSAAATGAEPLRVTLRRRWPDHVLIAGAAALALVWRWWALGDPTLVSHTAELTASVDRRLAVPLAALTWFLGLGQFLWPAWLSPEYADLPASAGMLALGWGALALLFAGAGRVAVAAAPAGVAGPGPGAFDRRVSATPGAGGPDQRPGRPLLLLAGRRLVSGRGGAAVGAAGAAAALGRGGCGRADPGAGRSRRGPDARLAFGTKRVHRRRGDGPGRPPRLAGPGPRRVARRPHPAGAGRGRAGAGAGRRRPGARDPGAGADAPG